VPADPERPGLVLDPTENVANPFVVPLANGDFRLFATNKSVFDKRRNIPVFQPFGIAHLRYVTDALPFLPGWAVPGRTWAPDVRRIHGRWVMYFTARYAGAAPASIPQGLQCIGVASSSKLLGPYSPAPAPVICQTDRGGSIDARTFIDADGSIWLHWKSDDNAALERDNPTGIFAARLSPWGTSLVTQPVEILAPTLPWEGHIVEAPQMVLGPDGTHWLFYSANWYNQRRYGMGVARCAGPAGPCTKPFDRWFGSNAQGAGPGEGSLFWSRGLLLMAYAPWHDGRSAITRPVALARIWFDARGPYFAAWTGVAPQRG
jgi:beta-xylosidase